MWYTVVNIAVVIIVIVVGLAIMDNIIDARQPQFDKDCIGQPNGTWVGWNISCDEFNITQTNHVECQNETAYAVLYCVYNLNVVH